MLKSIPADAHLSRLYFELADIGASCVGDKKAWSYKLTSREELVALACDMSRHDPRLIDILVNYFLERWRDINPSLLRARYSDMTCPQTVAVIMEFLKKTSADHEIQYLAEYLQAGIRALPWQFYFHNLYAPGGTSAIRAAQEGLYEFKKWGFLATGSPRIDTDRTRNVGSFDAIARRNILSRLLERSDVITLKQYLEAVSNTISRQQALLDLSKSGLVKSVGHGRGAIWKKAA